MIRTNAWIALFRGINVGGRNVLPMKDLVKDLQFLGFESVKTYLQSGNAFFESSLKDAHGISKLISTHIEKRHGFLPHVIILSKNNLMTAVSANPFREAESIPTSLHCFFLESDPLKADFESLTHIKSASESFQLVGRVLYLHAPDGFGRSKLAANIEKHLGVVATARNWRTVQKLVEISGPD